MAHYWGRFVPSVASGLGPGEWERFYNAEVPGRALRRRARSQAGEYYPEGTPHFGARPRVCEFPGADMSAIMLVWLTREMPEADKAPDEVWHLTDRGGLLRTPWSVIVDPIDESEVELDDEPLIEPTIDNHQSDEVSIISWTDQSIEDIWRPPTPQEIADRKVYLIGDRRPTRAGAFSERAVERLAPRGLRKACKECGVYPSPFTLECKC